jgi:hypothetical protein
MKKNNSIQQIEKQVQDFIDQKVEEFKLSPSDTLGLITYLGHRLTVMSGAIQSGRTDKASSKESMLCWQESMKALNSIKKILEK